MSAHNNENIGTDQQDEGREAMPESFIGRRVGGHPHCGESQVRYRE
jgi:hypothetical protein